MICPQCATRNELGSQRCRVCRRPFTHEAYEAAAPARRSQSRRAARPVVVDEWGAEPVAEPVESFDATRSWSGQQVSAGRGRRTRSRRRPNGCLIAFGVLSIVVVGLLVAALLASNYIVKPMVRDAAVTDLRSGVRDEVNAQIADQIADAPEGEIVITDDEINQRLAAGDLGPIDDVTITIAPDVMTVDLSAYGLHGTYQSVIRAENGTVILDSGSLDGPLAFIIPDGELTDATNAEIAAALAAAGYQVESATMQDGSIALSVVR